MKNRIFSGSPFEKLAGYARAAIDGEWIFISGTVGSMPGSGSIPESLEDQVTQIFTTITATLAEAQSTLADVVRCRVFLADAIHVGEVSRLLGNYFGDIRPANTTLITGIPAPGAKVEIEVTARRGAGSRMAAGD